MLLMPQYAKDVFVSQLDCSKRGRKISWFMKCPHVTSVFTTITLNNHDYYSTYPQFFELQLIISKWTSISTRALLIYLVSSAVYFF